MSKVFIEETTLTAIGDAIREKTSSEDLIAPLDMATAISNLSSGGGSLKVAFVEGSRTQFVTTYNLSQYVSNVESPTWILFVRQGRTGTHQRGDIAAISPLLDSQYGYTGHMYSDISPSLDDAFSAVLANGQLSLLSQTHSNNRASFDASTNIVTATCSSSYYYFGKHGVLFYIE